MNSGWLEANVSKAPVQGFSSVSVGHDGMHALLLGKDGSVFFAGAARRGEDGGGSGSGNSSSSKSNRAENKVNAKPTRAKKMMRMDGIEVSFTKNSMLQWTPLIVAA